MCTSTDVLLDLRPLLRIRSARIRIILGSWIRNRTRVKAEVSSASASKSKVRSASASKSKSGTCLKRHVPARHQMMLIRITVRDTPMCLAGMSVFSGPIKIPAFSQEKRKRRFPVPALWNRNYFLRFRFRFRLLKSYGSGSGSGSNFWKSYGSGSGFGYYFWKVTVPVPVPAPYLDHKKQSFLNKFWNIFAFLLSKLFYKGKVYKFQQIFVKCEWKKFEMKEIKYIILYLVPVPEPLLITVSVPVLTF